MNLCFGEQKRNYQFVLRILQIQWEGKSRFVSSLSEAITNRAHLLQCQFPSVLKMGVVAWGWRRHVGTPPSTLLLLHIITDAKNRNTDTGRGARDQAMEQMRATAWQMTRNTNSTGNLLGSPLTPHGKLWKTFYLFRSHFGYHIASSFPPTQTVCGQIPRIWSVTWSLKP